MKHRISPSTIIACVALFFSLAGTGIAAQHYLITSLSQIKPSVRHELQGRSGPIGPQGSAGQNGQQGPAGAQGPSGAVDWNHLYSVASPTITLDAGGENAVASCNVGDQLLTGGFIGSGDVVTSSAAFDGSTASDAWRVTAHLDPSADAGSVEAWAVCVSM